MKIRKRAFSFISVSVVTVAWAATSTLAQVRGSYSPGSTVTAGGTVPDPGFSYANQYWYFSASQLKGPQGKVLPITGQATFKVDNNNLTYIPKFKFLRANLAFAVDIEFSNGSFVARDPLAGGPEVGASAAGPTDTTVLPFDLGWHLKWADLQTGYSLSVPTGKYSPGASDNVSAGFWTHFWQGGATIYLSKSKATQASIFDAYGWNTTQRGTGVHPGQNESVDYSLTQTIPLTASDRWPLQFGGAGYGQWQTTKASGQNPIREELRYRVYGAGPTINLSTPFKGLAFGATAMWDYGARNTYEGHVIVFNLGFNL